jgi:hypothetical protein
MNLTEIFPPETLPVRSGVYLTTQVDPETGESVSSGTVTGYSYFDATDRVWGCSHMTIEEAIARPEYEFAWQYKRWQGMTKEVA